MPSQILMTILFITCFSLLFWCIIVESRLIDGSDNNAINPTAGTPHQPFLRAISSLNFNQNSSPVTSPTDSLGLNPIGPTTIKCTDNLSSGLYPMPRCISNIMCSYNVQPYNVNTLSNYRSFRRTSHFNTNPTYPIFIPADDPLYNPNPNSTISPYQINVPFLPANRSDGNNDTNPATRNPLLSGINNVTPFFDLNNIYGISDQDAMNRLRDTSTNKGKLKTYTVNGEDYPPKNSSDGSYIWGSTSERSYSIFTLAIQTIWIREHNRLCEELYNKHGNSWTDEQYFQEAKRWTIAFYQKAVSEEYIGAILGRPLPAYQNYNPNLVPGVDAFFATVTFRYGHSELSDFYQIQDEYDNTLYNLPLNDIKNLSLLETFGLERVLWSIVLQRQEEVDIFLADSTKKALAPDHNTYDIAAFDIERSRDRGIPLYNVVRQYFGFPKAQSFADISSKANIQANLAKIYPNGIETVEAWVGVMSEDHLDGANFGMVMNASMVTQVIMSICFDSDNFWFEKSDMFTSDEQIILRNTTLRDIIVRNINQSVSFPQNIWSVQPQTKLSSSDDNIYPTKISSWTQYVVSYRVDLTYVYFKVQLQTSNGNGWFGMGFDPKDNGMTGAEFIIGIVTNGNVTLANYHADVGGYHPPLRDSNQDPTLVPTSSSMSDAKAVTVEFKRLLNPPGRKPIVHGDMKYIMAYNPNSNAFSYHQNNRMLVLVNFYNSEISVATTAKLQSFIRVVHGCGMFFTWCILFPASVFIVRYLKHYTHHLKIHRLIQLIGGISVSSFGAAAISTQIFIANSNTFWWKITYGCWMFIIATIFLLGEIWWRFEGLFQRFLCVKDEDIAEKKTMMHTHINHKEYTKLPEFTWEEINERVQCGAYLVVCDGLVVDIRSWCSSHPDFYNTHKNQKIVEDLDSLDVLLIQKDTAYGSHSSMLAKYINHLRGRPAPRPQKRRSVAKFVDNMNVKFYLREPLAQHTHSRFATQKMATMVIGKVIENASEKGPFIQGDGSIYQTRETDSIEIDGTFMSTKKSIKFHRYKLTSKEMINANIKYPVIRFTFSIVHQGAKDISTEKFLPGHYIEVQSRVNGQIVIRSYTPLEGSLSKSFSIYVKIYPRGLFSQHLSEQLIGYEIQARGPFDVGDRFKPYAASTLPEPLSSGRSILSPIRTHAILSPVRTHANPTAKTSLLNPDSQDGCWDELYMIAGGSGITPMLQSMKRKNDAGQYVRYKQMHLLFGNRSIEDVVDGILLEDLALSSRGQLTVTYCLSEPPSDWDGLQGRINKQIIQDWIDTMKGRYLLSPNKSQITAGDSNYMNILQSHSIRRDANEQNQSIPPLLKPQSPIIKPQSPIIQPQYEASQISNFPTESSVPLVHFDDNKIYDEDSIVDIGPRSASTRKSKIPKNIDPHLANLGKRINPIQGKIIVCGPSSMLITVEQALLEMGYNEQDMIILH
ncbi:5507_t:CDS:10 [Scutellospora calospora]|uniref:5507_t:CDS:1 n=1 Tax=Scutellospora calospora TaxID=85575 RepID=A0ACA9JUL5_9GLOM|nr:5507_t:CDS:10 [Scutellospora calospora]